MSISDCHFGPLVAKPKEACRLLACGITRLYELIAAGELETFRDGRSRKVTTESIRRYVAKQLAPASAVEPKRDQHNGTNRATAASLASRTRRKADRSRTRQQRALEP
jgi:excisionase family DNA binding protein